MNRQNHIKQQIQASFEMKQAIYNDDALIAQIESLGILLTDKLKAGHKILLAGNGGSAADAQHIACELVGRFYVNRPAISAIALTTDTSILTAVANDLGYENIFARQVEALGQPGDVFIGISTSGTSGNIIQALSSATERGLYRVGLTGENSRTMAELCDVCLCLPSSVTPRIQEGHILIGHILCEMIEATLFPNA